jgi:two-component system sensor histidine kinase CpxA
VRSLFTKFLVGFWIVLAMMIAAETVLETESLNRGLALHPERATGPLALYASLGRDALARGGPAALDSLRGRLLTGVGVASSRIDSAATPDPFAPDVPDGARRAGLAALHRRSGVLREDHDGFFVAWPIGTNGGRPIALAMWPRGEKEDRQESRLGALLPVDLVVRAGVMLLLGGLASLLLARSVTAPITRLRHAADRLSQGDLSARFGARPAGPGDELDALGRDFDRMADRIEALVGAQRRLLRDISHELRSPLARMSVALGLLRDEKADEPLVDRLEREIGRLDRLIEDVLVLSRSEAGEPAAEPEPVELDSLLREVADDARFEAAARGCEVHLEGRTGATVHGRRTLLRSAFENVVRNAIEHTAGGTRVEIAAGPPDARDGVVTVTVRDRGPGLPADLLERVFEPFYRVDAARERRAGGTGLGLAIARHATVRHGGTIAAANADGGGLIVTLRVPASS